MMFSRYISTSRMKVVGAGLALTMPILLMTGCGSSGAGGTSGGPGSQTTGVVLKAGNISEPDSLDPAEGTGGNDYPFLYSLYDRLLNLNPKTGDIESGLATSWGFDDSNTKFTVKLRPGLKFADGTVLDANAVVQSVQHYKNLGHQHDMDPVKSVAAVGDDSVEFTLSEPFSALPAALADRAGMIVSPAALKKYGDSFGQHPVGAGPYTFKSWASGVDISMTKNPNYWDAKSAHLGGIDYKLFPSSTAMASALTTGQIDYGYGFDLRDLPTLQKSSSVTTQVEPSLQFYDIALNNAKAPTNNVYVRRAMNIAIDRDVLNKSVLGGKGQPAYLPVPSNSTVYTKLSASETPTYDPEKAKQLIKQSGLGDSVTVPVCLAAHQNGGSQLFSLMQSQMSKSGIDLKPTVSTGVDCNERFVAKKTIGAYMKGWSGRPDPYLTYSQNFSSSGLYNVGGNANGDMDKILAKIAKTTDPAAQKPLYDELNREYLDQVPYIATLYVPTVVAYGKDVKGEIPNFMGKPNLTSLSVDK